MTIAGLGCAAVSHYITPANIDKDAVYYAVDAGTASPDDYTGYANLEKVERLKGDVDAAHSKVQLNLQQQIEADNLDYSIHSDSVASAVLAGTEREEMLFGEKGLVSMGLGLAGFGTLTGLLGLMRKRPGDVTLTEMEQALASLKGQAADQLSTKDKQFIQVVKGVQEYIDFLSSDKKNTSGIKKLKGILDKHQDVDTKTAVATAKV